jgi:hypothetical protein
MTEMGAALTRDQAATTATAQAVQMERTAALAAASLGLTLLLGFFGL